MNGRIHHWLLSRMGGVAVFLGAVGLLSAPSGCGAGQAGKEWGTFYKPFAVDSPWNSRPIDPVLGDFVIPKSSYYPMVGEGKYSLEVFLAKPSDAPMTVTGPAGSKGLWDPDAEAFRDIITIPRWPEDAKPAEGSDGHADIVDPVTGMVHSFSKLRRENGQWVAMQYAWTRMDGRGWGDPAHYFQGARAAAVPSMGGLIRKHEVNDGDSIYRHALAVSLTFNALAPKPGYVFPATSSDGNWSVNYGSIPEGALLMLPESFDTGGIKDPALRKVSQTLKVYGAYVVDRNVGTPFYIVVENGSGFNLHPGKWNSITAADLDRIRQALRQVVAVRGWLDGDGREFVPERNLNLLSMRGPWRARSGPAVGGFDTWLQAVAFPESAQETVLINTGPGTLHPVSWAQPVAGDEYVLTAIATGGARLRLQLRDRSGATILVDSGDLVDGQSFRFAWPSQNVAPTVWAISAAGRPSSVRGTLVAGRPAADRRPNN